MVADDGDREGTPNSVMEAAAAGLPVIATRHGGITDVVVEGMTGFLVDEGDYEAMAERMCELLEDPEKCRKMGTSAREMAKSQFSKAIHNQIVRSRITIAG
jgi:glycosyltransferase involved in cell wall biosynthesis